MTAPTVGTLLPEGSPVPASSTHKATAAVLWGVVPVVLGAVVEALDQTGRLFPTAPTWVLSTVALLLVILGPIASYFGVKRTPNLLKVAVVIASDGAAPSDPPPSPTPG